MRTFVEEAAYQIVVYLYVNEHPQHVSPIRKKLASRRELEKRSLE